MTGRKRTSPYALVVACLLFVSACGASASSSTGVDESSPFGQPDSELAAMLLTGEPVTGLYAKTSND